MPIAQYSLAGDLIAVHASLAEAAAAAGVSGAAISRATSDPKFSSGGYRWRTLYGGAKPPPRLAASRGERGQSVDKIEQLSPSGALVARHASMTEAARAVGVSKQAIAAAVRTGRLSAGFRWRRR